MTDLTMPRLSDAMEEGTILRWLKHDGEEVRAEEELVEIETDKATVTHPAEASGRLEIVVSEGSTVAVGTVIARVGAAVETEARPADVDGGALPPGPADVPTPPLPEEGPATPTANGSHPEDGSGPGSDAPAVATPLARRAAREHGVDLGRLTGSGPRGRIRRADVLSAAGVTEDAPASTPALAREAPPAASAPVRGDDFELQEPTRIQQVIARRMAEAKATVPDFEVETEVVMDQALALRAGLRDPEPDSTAEAVLPSLNDFVIKACARALRRHPRVNASYVDGRFKLHRRVNVGVAVAAQDALIVPVVRDADTKSLGELARETRRLAARVRDGQVTPPELSGGTFTVSNLGMFGMTAIRPVINLPQAAILGVGAIREVLARVDGEIVERRVLTLTLTADHRILYGADAARFLSEVKALLEAPLRLLL